MGQGSQRPERPDDALLARVVTDDASPTLILNDDFAIIYANDACRRYGWEPDDLVGRGALDLIHPDDLPRAIVAANALHARAGEGTAPYRFQLPDGTFETMDVASVMIDGGDGPDHLAFSLRPNPFDRARTESFRAMVSGEPPETSLAGLAAEFSASRPAGLIAFDGHGQRTVAGPLPPALGGVFDGRQDRTPGMPWTRALEGDDHVTITSVDGLPDDVRAAAAARGVQIAAFLGSPDPGRPQRALMAAWSDDPTVLGILAMNLRDIDSLVRLALERRMNHERLDHLAHHDPLTGLANRASYFAQLDLAVQRQSPLAVAYLDLDGFKAANDRYGHAAGDQVLVEFGRRFAREMRAGDLVARLGGDEFAVLIADPPDEAAAAAVIERLLAAARKPVELAADTVTLAASAGLVLVDDPRGTTSDALVHLADTALYTAKRSGKGTLRLNRGHPATGEDRRR